ncbi:MAG TPA: 3-phosphoshikimate 1-carboxyvinyltransferase, partial [Flavobacteriales bacterium]|nr:3-phosphoshikimate 1-carboxyvinyltransferase [Flavobacteriales bacterium]
LRDDGLQGDAQAAALFAPWTTTEQQGEGLLVKHRSGGKEQHRSDLRDTPDLFQPLVMTCAGRGEGAVFTGLDNLHLKESDRLAAVQQALERLGAQVQVEGGTFTLEAGRLSTAPEAPFDPRHDHRMAMSLAPLAAVCGTLRIADPEVVAKSYPAFWRHLEQAGFRVER